MGKTSSAAKRRWNKENYDICSVSLPKGLKDRLKEACEREGVSINSVFATAAAEFAEAHPVEKGE